MTTAVEQTLSDLHGELARRVARFNSARAYLAGLFAEVAGMERYLLHAGSPASIRGPHVGRFCLPGFGELIEPIYEGGMSALIELESEKVRKSIA